MATLRTYQYSEMPPRRKIRYFQFALLRMARLMYLGPGAGTASITVNQYQSLEKVYHKPFWKSALTSGVDLLPWAKGDSATGGAGSGYHIGDILTLVQAGASGGKVVVARINAQGGVTAVLPLVPGTGYKLGFVTTTATNAAGGASSGTGAVIGLRPVYGTVVDIVDQMRIDVQGIAATQVSQLFGPNTGPEFQNLNGPGVTGNARQPGATLSQGGTLQAYSESYNIKDWGNPNTVLKWLTSLSNAACIGSPANYSGATNYQVGQLAVNSGDGKTYMCYRSVTGTGPNGGVPTGQGAAQIGFNTICKILGVNQTTGVDPYWVILPTGSTANPGQLLNPVGVTIASMVGRIATVFQGNI